ncbi:MAG: hypothetical protein JXQ87_16145 [Bacteroidia bacterium]
MNAKNLILIRHSYANSQSEDGDFGRTLSEHGILKLNSQIEKLSALPKPKLIHVSSAKRTLQTCEWLNRLFKVTENHIWRSKELYHGSAHDYASIIESTPEQINSIALIAHNPSISYFGNSLCSDFVQGFSPGDILWLRSDNSGWNVQKAHWELELFLSE